MPIYHPNTCHCAVEVEFDKKVPIGVRVGKIVAVHHEAFIPVERLVDGEKAIEVERHILPGPCGMDHPNPVVGEIWDSSAFIEHHITTNHGPEHYKRCVADNPHWKS